MKRYRRILFNTLTATTCSSDISRSVTFPIIAASLCDAAA